MDSLQRLLYCSPDERDEFNRIFGLQLQDFFKKGKGFDVVSFDAAMKVPNGASLQDFVQDKYGENAVALIKQLAGG